MYDDSQKHRSRSPAVQPVESFVRYTSQDANRIELAGEQIDEWNLSDRHPGCPKSDFLPFVCVHGIAWTENRATPEQA